MNRTYEVIFILRPDLAEDEADQLVSGLEAVVTGGEAQMRKLDRLGRRRLAYPIRGFREGNYVLFDMEAGAETVRELQRRLRVSEPVIKFLAVRTDETTKRLERDRQRREARLQRRPATPAPTPSVEAEMASSAEAEERDSA